MDRLRRSRPLVAGLLLEYGGVPNSILRPATKPDEVDFYPERSRGGDSIQDHAEVGYVRE